MTVPSRPSIVDPNKLPFGSQRFTIRLNWFLIILLVALGLIVAFIFVPTARAVLLFVAPVLGGAAGLIAAFNAIDARVAGSTQAKKAVSLQFVHCWLNPSFFHAKKHGREIVNHLKENPGAAVQKQWLEEDPDRLANLFDVLNLFETMSVCIQEGLADELVLERSFKSIVREYWHASSAFVQARRDERNNARLLKEVEWLFTRWNS